MCVIQVARALFTLDLLVHEHFHLRNNSFDTPSREFDPTLGVNENAPMV